MSPSAQQGSSSHTPWTPGCQIWVPHPLPQIPAQSPPGDTQEGPTHLMTVGVISAQKKTLRLPTAWDANMPTTEKATENLSFTLSLIPAGYTGTVRGGGSQDWERDQAPLPVLPRPPCMWGQSPFWGCLCVSRMETAMGPPFSHMGMTQGFGEKTGSSSDSQKPQSLTSHPAGALGQGATCNCGGRGLPSFVRGCGQGRAGHGGGQL